ncbi:Acetoin utilization deacetylase AcuC [Flagellimonas taeanensis]|uniref:Acetoin utilization deacetylase AcuC n=1 Tax=Flagellimonas taeanensis TaxID=1005926 RepID=A0A1M6YAN6_9FLAO|nr:histone deacetylase [Allomuricauda taeanensis]SFC06970.1 Acetoin utilization deacetylase AcuC [Allomuricauda taeanensis]SHL15172.1 Acetoin utilization deacetylase AcuC [Allomuricauda taeanensis]
MLKIAYHPIYKHHLPDGHRFPMAKYELLPQQLLHEGTCSEEHFFEPSIPDDGPILAVHDAGYYHDLLNLEIPPKEARKIGFPLSKELVLRERIIADGTIKGCEFALEHGIAMNIAGGTHHAYSNRGEAFCMLNDQAIGARYLRRNKQINNILIVDLDVHQGNGTAEIFQTDRSVFTFSMHGKGNYPFKKEVSDLDIPLEKGTTDEEYLSILKKTLPSLFKKVRPEFIFYLCGVDVLETDKLGTLSLSLEGCKERDRFVMQTCHDANIPVQCSMGGGYSPDIKTIVEAHANTFRLAQDIYA